MTFRLDNNQFAFGNVSEALHLVINWVEALHGRGGTAASLDLMLRLVSGRGAALIRLQLDTGVESALERVEPGAADTPLRRSGISFPQYLLGHGLGQAQGGSVWYLSELAREVAADERAGARLCIPDERTREIAAIVLEPRTLTSDILELQFPARLTVRDAEALSMLAGVLSRGWVQRSPDIFPGAADHGRVPGDAAPAQSSAILSATNPAGLSRSEYRVCELVSRGLSAKAISGMLLISESTVRSHLRGIYSKTKASGQRELMYKLLGSGGPVTARPVALPPAAAQAGGPAGAGRGAADVG